jgi:hypothetical protein
MPSCGTCDRAGAGEPGEGPDLSRNASNIDPVPGRRASSVQLSGRVVELPFSHSSSSTTPFTDAVDFTASDSLPICAGFRDAGALHLVRETAGSRPAICAFRPLLGFVEGRT